MNRNQKEGFPLSPQQRLSWSLSALDPTAPYLARCAIRIDGPLDVEALRRSLDDVVEAHEILRTTFHRFEEMTVPLQVVEGPKPVPLDIRQAPAEAGEAWRVRAIDEFFREPGESVESKAPLVRLRLLVSSPDRHTLLMRAPAICSDRVGLHQWARSIVQGLSSEVDRSQEPPELQYVDAAAWLNDLLESPETDAGRKLWQRQDLASLRAVRLPFEARRSSTVGFRPERVGLDLRLPADAARLSPDERPPREMLLLACWQNLLHRFTEDSRLFVAWRSDGRSYEELDHCLGPFAKLLPLAGDLSPEVQLDEALVVLRSAREEAERWGECFDTRGVAPGDEGGGTAASFPFQFDCLEVPSPERRGELTVTTERLEDCVDRFELKLLCRREGDELSAEIHYDPDVYAREDVERLSDQLEHLWADAARRPGARLGELRIAGDDSPVFADGGELRKAEAPADLIHHRIEAWAETSPNAPAVSCGDETMTYRELVEGAGKIASRLVGLGVGPDVVVGVLCERSLDMLLAMLGILRAGGAYMPLDPVLPDARLEAMLESSGAKVVVAQRKLADKVPGDRAAVVTIEDGPTERIERIADGRLSPQNLAYVLFTSGSTGRPKAVAVEHRQLSSYVLAVSEALDLPARLSYATVTTFAADLGNTAIFPALSSGGHLHVPREDVVADAEAFAGYFERHPVDVLKIVPSHLEALLSCNRPERVLPRKRLVLGGEASSWALVDRVRELAPQTVVFNHYGPTEATVGVSVARLAPREAPRPLSPPIGRPIRGARLYVLDGFRQPVPPWVPGELYIGGAGVARGYVNDREATERSFALLGEGESVDRVYRTGDRVRLLPEGELEFLGRVDEQVKIRGFRVEPGEIEAALRTHPGLHDVACLARESDAGDKRLVAYVVGKGRELLSPRELRLFLERELPDYMVPASFVVLEALPLTPNGKLDRRSLPPPADARRSAPADAPETAWESLIAGVWSEFLEVGEVGANDNFYDLGGHSLLAIRVVTKLEKETGLQVSPRELVFHTLRQFAAICERMSSDAVLDGGA